MKSTVISLEWVIMRLTLKKIENILKNSCLNLFQTIYTIKMVTIYLSIACQIISRSKPKWKTRIPITAKFSAMLHCSMVISLNYYCIEYSPIYECFKLIIEEAWPNAKRKQCKKYNKLEWVLEKRSLLWTKLLPYGMASLEQKSISTIWSFH